MDRVLNGYRLALRLLPAAALLSLLVALDGALRWLGLLGLIPLALAFVPGLPGCLGGSCPAAPGHRLPPGH
jgi:hypothetical protein